ncbi:MAG: large-conductance mechanosensitive channel protein MscL [Bacteroidales bacterium]|nr:large-conductance mechanosensitive channel protein MscL [Bacteroidales bacterium]
MSKFIKEFKEFAMKGNVMDMAIGVVIGAAFGAIVTSLVADLIMPLISWATGGLDFSDWRITLRAAIEATETTDAVEGLYISYGNFINVLFNFIIIALSIFLVIKGINKMSNRFESEKAKKEREEAEAKAKAEAEAPAPESEEVKILKEIRDALKK